MPLSRLLYSKEKRDRCRCHILLFLWLLQLHLRWHSTRPPFLSGSGWATRTIQSHQRTLGIQNRKQKLRARRHHLQLRLCLTGASRLFKLCCKVAALALPPCPNQTERGLCHALDFGLFFPHKNTPFEKKLKGTTPRLMLFT